MQVNMNGSEANLAFPGMLNEQLAAFAGSLEDADTPPTTQQQALYTSLHEKLQAQLALWKGVNALHRLKPVASEIRLKPGVVGLQPTQGITPL